VQTCIVHLIRACLRYVNCRDKRKVAAALKPIYTAANADAALSELERFDSQWAARYPATVAAWRTSWEHVTPFLALPDELRRAVYTTNTIEGLHRQIRKAIKTRGHFPDEQAATELIYLAIIRADNKWRRHHTWSAPRAALKSTSETATPAEHHPSTSRHGPTHRRPDSLSVSDCRPSSIPLSSDGKQRAARHPERRRRPASTTASTH
jgi:transposase-like protein